MSRFLWYSNSAALMACLLGEREKLWPDLDRLKWSLRSLDLLSLPLSRLFRSGVLDRRGDLERRVLLLCSVSVLLRLSTLRS